MQLDDAAIRTRDRGLRAFMEEDRGILLVALAHPQIFAQIVRGDIGGIDISSIIGSDP
jgi:hypothetical protein